MDHSRRSFLKAGIPAAFTIVQPELVRGAGREMVRAGIVGCGGRGTQAITDILTADDRVELVAMADLFPDKIARSMKALTDAAKWPAIQSRIKVDRENQFTGFDSYKKILESDVDVVMLCTPPVYRPEMFEAAVEARKHIFAEKPFGVDPVGVRRVMAAARKSEQLKLSVMAGTQRRSAPHYVQTVQKIHDGAIGEVVAAYAWWLGNAYAQEPNRLPDWKEVENQTRNWYSYRWLSGDGIVEQHVHNLDVINWVMNAHPVSVVSTGGVAWRDLRFGNNYDHFNSDFEYPNGVRMTSAWRQYPKGSVDQVEELVVGAKGRSKCDDMAPKGPLAATVQEHKDLIASIRGTGPYINRAMAVAESTMTAIMAREAAYSGLKITWDQIMNSKLELRPPDISLETALPDSPPPKPGEYKFL